MFVRNNTLHLNDYTLIDNKTLLIVWFIKLSFISVPCSTEPCRASTGKLFISNVANFCWIFTGVVRTLKMLKSTNSYGSESQLIQ